MKRSTYLQIVTIISFILLTFGSAVAEPEGWKKKVDAIFSKFNSLDQPGVSFAIVRDGKVVYSGGFGSANLEYRIKNSASTIFHVASVSKQFTCFAVQLLAEDGKLSLDDDVRKHLPWVSDFGETITLRQLMHHISGLRDQWQLLAIAGNRLDDVITMEHLRKLLSKQRELNFPPGTDTLYSNSGYTLLAEVVESVSKVSFKQFTHERIFKPLGMVNSHFHDDHRHIVPNRAYSYSPTRKGFQKSVLSYANVGATSLFTTAEDLALWLINLSTGSVGGKEVLKRMLERGVLKNGKPTTYASGLIHGEHRTMPLISHGGSDAGFRSHVAYLPENNLSVVVLSNRSDSNTSKLVRDIIDVIFDHKVDPPTETKEDLDPKIIENSRVPVEKSVLERYVGSFLLDSGYLVRLYREGEKLYRRHNKNIFELIPHSEREFVESNGLQYTFDSAVEGNVLNFKVLTSSGKRYRGERIDEETVNTQGQLVGRYYCPELDTAYLLLEENGRLIARHSRNSDTALFPLSSTHFRGRNWFFRDVKFEFDKNGKATGFRLSGGRVRNLLFIRKNTMRHF